VKVRSQVNNKLRAIHVQWCCIEFSHAVTLSNVAIQFYWKPPQKQQLPPTWSKGFAELQILLACYRWKSAQLASIGFRCS
jgi:hypothetical protein